MAVPVMIQVSEAIVVAGGLPCRLFNFDRAISMKSVAARCVRVQWKRIRLAEFSRFLEPTGRALHRLHKPVVALGAGVGDPGENGSSDLTGQRAAHG